MPTRSSRRKWPPAARLIGRGTTSPMVQIRNARGHWVDDSGCSDEVGDQCVRRFEGLATWARRQGAIAERSGRA